MKSAGWKNARADMDDIRVQSDQDGYSGVALANVERAVGGAIQVLSQCPAVNDDWNIRSSDWTLFRLRVSQALEDLKSFAEGRDSARSESTATNVSQSGTYSQNSEEGGEPSAVAHLPETSHTVQPSDGRNERYY